MDRTLLATHTLRDVDGDMISDFAYAVPTKRVNAVLHFGGTYTISTDTAQFDIEYRGDHFRMILSTFTASGAKSPQLGSFANLKAARDFANSYIGAGFAATI